jgi:tripartite-type tricarboxylate transporter receptor subunit TctC
MRILGALAAALSLLLIPVAAAAQDFPSKPIKLIVPFPPGGPNDIIARVVGQRMTELTKQPIVIENRSGQAGVLGTDAVAKAVPDGYTIGSLARARSSSTPGWKKPRTM